MTAVWRALLGAVLGAVLTLLAHPASRPYLLGLRAPTTPEQISNCIDSRWPKLPEPTDLLSASLWMQEASERYRANRKLRDKEIETLVQVAANASEKEPQNAYWHQMRALLLVELGREDEAEQEWRAASMCVSWNDYQTRRLMRSRESIAAQYGGKQAWQLAYVYFARSSSSVDRIQILAQQFVAKAGFDSEEDIRLRYQTLRNGVKLRNGSQSVDVGIRGVNIIELASYPREVTRVSSPKRLWLAENAMVNKLRELGLSDEAKLTQDGFRSNDAWKAMALRENPDEYIRTKASWSLLTATLPSLLLFIALGGMGVWGLGWAVERFSGLEGRYRLVHALVGGVLLAVIVQVVTGFTVAAVATALCLLFATVGPKVSRKAQDEDLGPFFNFSIGVLALAFALTASAYLMGRSPQAIPLLPEIGVPPEYYGESTVFFGLSAIMFALLFLFAPMWALVQHYATPFVLTLSLKRFGTILAVGGLVLCALTGPAMVYFDRQLEDELSMIVSNEPLYYLLK